jgi:hypothetical protein
MYRHHIAVSKDYMTISVGGFDGTIHIYGWNAQMTMQEKLVITYPRVFINPRTITFTFLRGAQFLVMGGERELVSVYDLVLDREVVLLSHQSEFVDHVWMEA